MNRKPKVKNVKFMLNTEPLEIIEMRRQENLKRRQLLEKIKKKPIEEMKEKK